MSDGGKNNSARYKQSVERKDRFVTLISTGMSVMDALKHKDVGVSYSAYRQWRARDKRFAAKVDVIRGVNDAESPRSDDMSSAEFAYRYFGRMRAAFQQQWIDTFESMRPGDILLTLWPPEHGKTTTFEDYATEQIARRPEYRMAVAGESGDMSQRILGRIRNRLEAGGPYPDLVYDWGPFKPEVGRSAANIFRQPWNNKAFAVFANRQADQREPNMLALGRESSILSVRTDHLHIDDIQSTKTLNRTKQIMEWFRQDALTRPGETGRTSINGSRVGEDDFYEGLLEDPDLQDMLHVLQFPAMSFNLVTEEWEALWPEMYSMEKLERMRRKVGEVAWNRNYMHNPAASNIHRTFSDAGIARSTDETRKLNDPQGVDRSAGATLYLSLDPALGKGWNCIQGWHVTNDRMTLVYMSDRQGLERNEDIVDELRLACRILDPHFVISDLVVEAMNFQKGLARDERLKDLRDEFGFQMREHLTGVNKYDANIGIASMAGSFEAGQINLPYDPEDQRTRYEIDEFVKQLKRWKPHVRGNVLRQDRVMAAWFAWILWQSRRKTLTQETRSWQRNALPWGATDKGLILPIGALR